mgnify:FL=1
MKYLKTTEKSSGFNLNYIIVCATMALALFHISTFFQEYYTFYATCGIALAIFLFFIIFNFRHLNFMDVPLLLVMISSAVIISMGAILKDKSLTEMFGKYFPYILWPLLYRLTRDNVNRKLKAALTIIFIAFFAVSVILTLTTLSVDSNASRLLAGKATESERASYYAKGVGGYGFVFGSVFISYALVKFGRRINFKPGKIAIIALLAVIAVMVILASYTTAIILFFILLFVSAFTSAKKHNWIGFVLLFAGALLVILFRNSIFEMFAQLGKNLELPYVENRFTQLLRASDEGSVEGLRRYTLYKESLDAFFSQPLTGAAKVGGHSEIFDLLGMYGVLAIPFIVSQALMFRQMAKDSVFKVEIVYWIFFAYMFIDTVDSIVTIPIIYYILPFILSYSDDEKERLVLPINDKGVKSVYEKSRSNNSLL